MTETVAIYILTGCAILITAIITIDFIMRWREKSVNYTQIRRSSLRYFRRRIRELEENYEKLKWIDGDHFHLSKDVEILKRKTDHLPDPLPPKKTSSLI